YAIGRRIREGVGFRILVAPHAAFVAVDCTLSHCAAYSPPNNCTSALTPQARRIRPTQQELLTGMPAWIRGCWRLRENTTKAIPIHHAVTDPSGSSTSSSCTVTVPHDQSCGPAAADSVAFIVAGADTLV